MLIQHLRAPVLRSFKRQSFRSISTLQNNQHIVRFQPPTNLNRANEEQYVFPNTQSLNSSHLLSLLPNDPPSPSLAIGTTTTLPPTPDSFSENPKFLAILQEVLKAHAYKDEGVISQAQAFASTAGSALGSGGAMFPNQQRTRKKAGVGGGGGTGGDGAGGASSQGGAGGGGRGGWVHLSDSRNPPDYGRIAWPEDIFGSLQVDGKGELVGEAGEYQASGTYRIVTRDGMSVYSLLLVQEVLTLVLIDLD